MYAAVTTLLQSDLAPYADGCVLHIKVGKCGTLVITAALDSPPLFASHVRCHLCGGVLAWPQSPRKLQRPVHAPACGDPRTVHTDIESTGLVWVINSNFAGMHCEHTESKMGEVPLNDPARLASRRSHLTVDAFHKEYRHHHHNASRCSSCCCC